MVAGLHSLLCCQAERALSRGPGQGDLDLLMRNFLASERAAKRPPGNRPDRVKVMPGARPVALDGDSRPSAS